MNIRGYVLVLLLAVVAVGWAEKSSVQTVAGFRVPEYDDKNQLKSQMFGDFAKVLPDGVIEITQLKIDFYSDGKVNMTVTAPRCTYKQKEGMAESDADVRITREDMVVTGKGFAWSGRDEQFRIFKGAKVVLKAARKQMTVGATE
jgi:lipopolysaccharide export system protein LptC